MIYYFLGSLLTPIDFDHPSEISYREFKQLLEENLSAFDLQQMRNVLSFFDIDNLHLFSIAKDIREHGNWTLQDIEKLHVETDKLEPWLSQILEDSYFQNKVLEKPLLQSEFFINRVEKNNASSRVLSVFWESLWIMAFIRAQSMNRLDSLEKEPGSAHPLVASWLGMLKVQGYQQEIASLQACCSNSSLQPHEMAQEALKWQLSFLEHSFQDHFFSLERLLVHLLQLALIEQWHNRAADKSLEQNLSLAAFNYISNKGS